MNKNFWSWMAAGVGSLVLSIANYLTSGQSISAKSVGLFIGGAVLLRAANWVIANVGPHSEI